MATDQDPFQSLKLTESADGITFSVHVQPRASRTELCGLQGDALKIRLTSPPVEDAANRQLAEFIAKKAGIGRSRVSIIAGEKSRRKTVLVNGIDLQSLLTALRS